MADRKVMPALPDDQVAAEHMRRQLYLRGFEEAKRAALYVLGLFDGVPPEAIDVVRTLTATADRSTAV